jgi:hypothetical protein
LFAAYGIRKWTLFSLVGKKDKRQSIIAASANVPICKCCGARAARTPNFWPAPGQTKVVYFVLNHLEQDQANDKSAFFPKNHENILTEKLCKQVPTKLEVGAGSGAEPFFKSEPELERKQMVSAPQHCHL